MVPAQSACIPVALGSCEHGLSGFPAGHHRALCLDRVCLLSPQSQPFFAHQPKKTLEGAAVLDAETGGGTRLHRGCEASVKGWEDESGLVWRKQPKKYPWSRSASSSRSRGGRGCLRGNSAFRAPWVEGLPVCNQKFEQKAKDSNWARPTAEVKGSLGTPVGVYHKENHDAAWFTKDWFKQMCCFQVLVMILCR